MFVRPKQVGTIQLSALGGFCLTRENLNEELHGALKLLALTLKSLRTSKVVLKGESELGC